MANFQVFPGQKSSKAANKQMNKDSTIRTNAAKLGIDMTRKAIDIKKENAQIRAEGKTPVVKINSNPVTGKTQVSPMASKRGPSLLSGRGGRGGGAGGAFLENLK